MPSRPGSLVLSPRCAPKDVAWAARSLRKIDGDHPAAGGAQDLNRQNAHQARTDHRHRLSEGDVRLAYTLHGDGPNRGQASRLSGSHCSGTRTARFAGTKLISQWLA